MAGLLSKERIIAGPRFNRWWNVVAALAINLSIGQAYAFSVFNLPLARVLGVSEPLPEDWKLSALGWIFTLAYVFLGLSAGVGGKWQDRVGPRLSGVVAAFCFGSGLFLSALGVWRHQLSWLYLGYGVLGGCGLGLGFNTPISTLLRWFPDRRGLATGMAIMGFGGGAILAAPLSTALMRRFATSTSVGVAETFVVLGALYTTAMLGGAFLFRLPPDGFRPSREEAGSPAAGLTAEQAVRTRPFPLLWGVLLLNVTAGLGVLGQAAAMIQEVFDGVSAEAAGFFVALLSLFNMGGRLAWAWLSDRLGRRLTYALFFSLGPLLYAAVPLAGQQRSLVLFVGLLALIMSMYGGGFASMPAYVADVFGAGHVGAIHGRVLTALAAAGLLGPTLVNTLRELWIAQGYSKSHAYDATLYIMAGLLVLGFLCNQAVPPRGDRPGVGAGIQAARRRPPRRGQVVSAAANAALRTSGLVAAAVGLIFGAGLLAGWRLERYDAERGFDAEAERIAGVLRLAPGVNVGDIRAGTGRWTVDMARRVGPNGQVYATVGPNPAHELLQTVAAGGVDNVSVITRTPGASPRLPLGCCEAILVRAVYHDFADRRTLLASLRKNLKPGGSLAIIDFDEGTPEHAGGHGIARRTVQAEVTGAGFELREAYPHWSGNAFCLVFRQPAGEAFVPGP